MSKDDLIPLLLCDLCYFTICLTMCYHLLRMKDSMVIILDISCQLWLRGKKNTYRDYFGIESIQLNQHIHLVLESTCSKQQKL